MKKFYKTTALAAGMLCVLGGNTAFADTPTDMETIKQQLQQLISQNQQLTKRVAELEAVKSAEPGAAATGESGRISEKARTDQRSVIEEEVAKQLEEKGGQSINDYVTLSGLLEGEFAVGNDFEGNNFSSFTLSTVELGLDVEVNDWARGTLLGKYEGGEESDHLFLDEGYVTLGNFEELYVEGVVGKIYVPFGNYETNMIQDPMTLEIGEISDFGLSVGFEAIGIYGAVFGYNGMKDDGGSDVIKGYGAQLGYAFENDVISVDAGVSYVSNIADSGGINDFINDELGKETIQDNVDGLGAHAIATFAGGMLVLEYVTALDDFNDASAFDPAAVYTAEPSAWNVELGYGMEIGSMLSNFAIGYQGTSDAAELGLPKSRYIAAASFEVLPATMLTAEYFYDNDYNLSDGGTDNNGNVFTMQLAYEF